MLKRARLFLLSILGLIGLFVLTSILVTIFVDINQYKNEISQVVKEETGLDLVIDGNMSLGMLSGIHFYAENIKLSHKTGLIADIEQVKLGMPLSSIFSMKFNVSSLDIKARSFNLSRDKQGKFNIIPTSELPIEATQKEDNTFSIGQLSIHDVKLNVKQFTYLDDVESVDIKLKGIDAKLSLLPVIDHFQLVIDDPRVFVGFSYNGYLKIEQGTFDQYLLNNLSLDFEDQQGNFLADKISFSLIKQGKLHDLPTLSMVADGQLKLKLAYNIPEGYSEPLWSQPDIIKVGQFNFNLPSLNVSYNDYQFEAEQAHLNFEEFSIFEAKHYLLNDLYISSLQFDSDKVLLKHKYKESYVFKNAKLQLAHIPLIEKGHMIDMRSESFLKNFAKQGKLDFSSDHFSNNVHELTQLKCLVESKEQQIHLSKLSFKVKESDINANGKVVFDNTRPRWNFQLHTDKVDIQPIISQLNNENDVRGYAAIHNEISGVVEQSAFKISSGKISVKGKDIIVNGMDMDKILEDFQSTQSVGLLDVGAVALLGPAGVLVTKGNDYRNLTQSISNKGTSKIKQLNSEISFHDDVASMDDVAFSTRKYRLAVQGKVNIDKQQFIDFEVATVNKNGCPIYKEKVMGNLNSPKVKKVNVVVGGLINPVNSLVSKVNRELDIKCNEAFYNGGVKPPVN